VVADGSQMLPVTCGFSRLECASTRDRARCCSFPVQNARSDGNLAPGGGAGRVADGLWLADGEALQRPGQTGELRARTDNEA
jgi:hypothetical protein